MSKRVTRTGASSREYAAAEERLLDIFAPLSGSEETAATASASTAAATGDLLQQQEHEVDPSRDNMLHFISNNFEIHSLLSSSESSGFKGFDDDFREDDQAAGDMPEQEQSLIFGMYRNAENVELLSGDNLMGCETSKANANMALLDPNTSTDYMLTNGSESHQQHDEQLIINVQNDIEETQDECVIYDDDNVVLLTDEHCCEIVVTDHEVHGDHEMERAYLMSLRSLTDEPQQLNNNSNYDEENELPNGEQHVYLSDAALVLEQHQQQLLLEAAEEDVQQGSDSFVDNRPDICEVYDHELEEHDDECPVDEQANNFQQQLQNMDIEEQQGPTILLVSDAEEPQSKQITALPHSSTTEFPVSSTSMPNGSDYDDYDDDVGTAEEQSPPMQRKYVGLLKNTLSAEALDRRLANICQSQPQMSLSEKLASWDCANSVEAVEDVENFEAAFEQHEAEAEPAQQPTFGEFYESLRQSMTKITRNVKQRAAGGGTSANFAQDTTYSSDDVAMQKRPSYRRLLHVIPAEQAEPIVLDDDDEDDDDCYEVLVNPSLETLVPAMDMVAEPIQPDVKTIQTQTILPATLETKETSTTDLCNHMLPPVTQEYDNFSNISPVEMQHQIEVQQQYLEADNVEGQHLTEEQQHQQPVQTNSIEYQNDAQFYEQHEFCNYLGLTELATANAVATAMRELANSTVARRSLRVRTQQQLDRMRSDVRGKRRERHQQQQKQQQQQLGQQQQEDLVEENCGQQLISNTSSSSSSSSKNSNNTNNGSNNSNSSNKQNISMMGNKSAMTATTTPTSRPANSESNIYQMPSAMNAAPQTIEFFYRTKGGEQETHANSMLAANDVRTMSLEAAFAKVYAAAAPAQNELHETMQSRLRQAREMKPSIYIVKTLNNSAPVIGTEAAGSPQHSSPDHVHTNNMAVDQAGELVKQTRKTHKKPAQKSAKRRRTTAGGIVGTAQPDRELVTRSTTHINSKVLRNRKVSLLKSYELTDAAALGRGKQRLSGGSTPAIKRHHTPKTPKKTLKKPEQMEASYPKLQQQQQCQHYQLHVEQKQAKPKLKIPKVARALATQEHEAEQNKASHKRHLRAKSLPAALTTEQLQAVARDAGLESVSPDMSPMELQFQLAKPYMDTHEFITNHAVVSPPLYSASVRHYVNTVRNSKDMQLPEQPVHLQPLQPPNDFFNMSLVQGYAQLPKPALVYPPLSPPPSQRTPHFSRRSRQIAGSVVNTQDDVLPDMQKPPPGALFSLTKGSTALRNPLAGKNGKVLYMYYELEQLIVLQEKQISFWKYLKVFNMLQKATTEASNVPEHSHTFNIFGAISNAHQNALRNSADANKSDSKNEQNWVCLGGTRRPTNDIEVATPYANRLCVHNSTPVYIEMRSHPLEHHKRESKLLSLYVNVYYYCDEELRPKMHSVHLDSVNCEWNQVIYTSIADSRYFVMAWQQELVVGKPRAGICKYSLTPTLDTLASIREFKQLRHELKHIECLTEDRLIGYGQTRITIWDHRSGDTLMNYDLGIHLGHNLGVIHFPSFDIDQSSMLVLYQHVKEQNKWPELRIIACELSHMTPSHRVLHVHRLPSPQFDSHLLAVNTGDHLILKSPNDDEIWISTADPRQLTYLAPQGTQRFYTRQKSQIITMTSKTLTVDSIANHILKLATQQQQQMMTSGNLSGSQLPVSV